MKYSIFQSVEQELEIAIQELNTLSCSTFPSTPIGPSSDVSISNLEKMSYLLKFSLGGYYSHLLPDNRYK